MTTMTTMMEFCPVERVLRELGMAQNGGKEVANRCE